MAAPLATPSAQAENRLLSTVPIFDGSDPEEQPNFIDALERCFSLTPTLTNTGKASLAVLRFPANSSARKWYTVQLQRNDKFKNVDIWDKETKVEAVPEAGTLGQPGYVAAVPEKPEREGGLKAAIKQQWPDADDQQSMVKLQLTNKQNPGERICSWLPRVQYNIYRLHKTRYSVDFRTNVDHSDNYNLVLEADTISCLRLQANTLLQKVFEDLDTHTSDNYVEAATKWERSDEGKKWLASTTQPSYPAKPNPRNPTTAAVRGGPNRAQLPDCDYCGIKKSHNKAECFKRIRDVESGKIQDHVDGYPLVPQKNRRKRGGKVNAAGGDRGGPPGQRGPPGNQPNGPPYTDPPPTGPPTNAPFPPTNLPPGWNGAAASISGGDLAQLFEHQQRLAASSALAQYPQLANHPPDNTQSGRF